MEKDRCQINVTELDNGYRIDVTGENVKEDIKKNCNCWEYIQKCCGDLQKAAADKKSDGC